MSLSLAAWLQRLEALHPRSIELGLERCAAVYGKLGEPRPAKQVCTVAGTNGKGSVVAYMTALLRAAGCSTGTYTSPHILRFNERIHIDGQPARDEELVAAFEEVDAARGGISLTYFEFTTLAAFLLFHRARLDAAVLEVGLGGRLDAVNVVDADCAVITAIGLDHQEYLGPDRESIGYEKAGIMRGGRPVVIGDGDPPASVLAQATAVGARPVCYGRDFTAEEVAGGLRLSRPGAAPLLLPRPPMGGAHQLRNLATAFVATQELNPGLAWKSGALAAALGAVRVPGRLQRWQGDTRVLLDVGHNPLAAEVVDAFLAESAEVACHCVLGMLSDKDVESTARQLAPRIRHWYCAGLGGARGQSGVALGSRVAQAVPGALIDTYTDIAAALEAALSQAGPGATVLVFGSFQTVADGLRHLDPQANSVAQYC